MKFKRMVVFAAEGEVPERFSARQMRDVPGVFVATALAFSISSRAKERE